MQIVIDIPDRIYKITQNKRLNLIDGEIVENAIKNGTPLPKGHGKLKDVDKLTIPPEEMIARMIVQYAPTIIEADKESV